MSRKSKIISSLILNSIIVVLMIFGAIMSGCSLWNGKASLEGHGVENLKYYTWQSNIFAAIISAIYVICNILIIKGVKQQIPFSIYICKFVSLVALSVTFLTVVFVFFPILIFTNHYINLFENSNIFFHLIIPLLGIFSFVLFEYQSNIKYRFMFLSTTSITIYAIYYLINVLVHMNEDLTVDVEYDWYGYASVGIHLYPLSYLVTFAIAIGSAFLINLLGKKISPLIPLINENN